MKKHFGKIVVVILALVTALSFGACTSSNNVNKNNSENVCYYGCPNSKKVKKLNLLKRR